MTLLGAFSVEHAMPPEDVVVGCDGLVCRVALLFSRESDFNSLLFGILPRIYSLILRWKLFTPWRTAGSGSRCSSCCHPSQRCCRCAISNRVAPIVGLLRRRCHDAQLRRISILSSGFTSHLFIPNLVWCEATSLSWLLSSARYLFEAESPRRWLFCTGLHLILQWCCS